MRVLSRRRKFAKAVACGYSEGAGFVVLTEPSPLLCRPFCATRGRPVEAALASRGPGPEGVNSAVSQATHPNPGSCCPPPQQRPRRDGVGRRRGLTTA